ncbi:hypothetical protein FRB99_003285 [Tulasnella sp. 403]|nr:hypothetical protein FRB99_003285 [Tulasnella sp. 403]
MTSENPTIPYVDDVDDVDDGQSGMGYGPLSGISFQSPSGELASAATGVKDFDLLREVKGLYRLLDLYSENATGGLVDKIIISQDSLKNFLDTIRPGSYTSLIKIDFHALDLLSISVVGIYGSKTEIVRFLREVGAIDNDVERCLLTHHETTSTIQPHLRSGIYALIPPNNQHTDGSFNPHSPIYLIYWPEETTWDEDAIETVRKNRVTFMRYLTRLTDQIRALISPKHSSALVWEAESESDDDFEDRVFTFEVAKTNEQEEDVVIREGFKVSHQAITTNTTIFSLPDGKSKSLSLDPILLYGETLQTFADRKYTPTQVRGEAIDSKYSVHHLRALLAKYTTIHLADTVDHEGLEILFEDGGLKERNPELYKKYDDAMRKIEKSRRTQEADETRKALAEATANRMKLRSGVREHVKGKVAEIYPTINFDRGPANLAPGQSLDVETDKYFHHIRNLYPAVDEAVNDASNDQYTTLKVIKSPQYKAMKDRFFILQIVLQRAVRMPPSERREAIATLVSGFYATSNPSRGSNFNPKAYWTILLSKLPSSTYRHSSTDYLERQSEEDPAFVRRLASLAYEDQAYTIFANEVRNLARAELLKSITSLTDLLVRKIEFAHKKAIEEESRRISSALASKEIEALRVEYRRLFQEAIISNSKQPSLVISSVKKSKSHSKSIDVRGYNQHKTAPRVQHRLWVLETPEYDTLRGGNQRPQPKPRVFSQPVSTCSLPLTWNLRHIQMFNNRSRKHVLLVIDQPDSVGIWLFSLVDGPSFDKPTKTIPNMKNRRYTLACDEQSRLLAMVISDPDRCICQLFAMDESFTSIRSRGPPFNLLPWYEDGIPNIKAAAFFAGTEELCLVEENGRIRLFSVVARSFKYVLRYCQHCGNQLTLAVRPGMVRLNPGICHVQASPDGTALVVIEKDQQRRRLRVFHSASFGHKESGIVTTLPEEFNSATSFTLTSIGERRNVFLLALSPSLQCIHSVALEISGKETEYQFRAQEEKSRPTLSVPNALIACFSEVWDRYPVVAAIQRDTFAGSRRLPPSITFVSEDPDRPFESYFKQIIRDFEQLTKKPTGNRLDKISIKAARFEEMDWEAPVSSTYKAGEWLVELICLIPIHIALARDNRFVPLKDGILDPELERQLLGAEVANIIDAISVGWYESIFSSYMATKPVKVVSSMGEQSVGKSYCLNHLVDSSFAGSAVRTTEGVWLSVCPTKDALVVALDFEGVHSIERTPQEDMLLVLFNTALSNLVLFRNNFALSRDVTHMFTSFQASTHLLDPASNPKLFKGMLAILIKDVIDSDKKEIVREFTSKFNRIVSMEQADNFITALHNSRVTIIPWTVIQSREFYTLFSRLKKNLFDQQTTHATAGEFLITLKTLMAKLKAQDWGSIDQTVIKHRAAALTTILLNAFATGHAEVDPGVEDLKNLDNQEPIVATDSEALFYVGTEPQEIDRALSTHLQNWKPDAARESVQELQEHLNATAALRLAHVQVWFDVNTAKFPADNADIRELRRLFDDTSAALLANIQLCLAECAQCLLRCTLPKSHDVSAEGHDCRTSHVCQTTCDYADQHPDPEYCGLRINNPSTVTSITTSTAAKIGFPALSSVSCVSVTALSAITFMASAARRYTFVGKSTTVYTQVARRLRCAVRIPAGERGHVGSHVHSIETNPVHYCEQKCMNCEYFCHLPIGHRQAEHDTAHGSMENTSWAVEGAADVTIEVQGRKFGAQDNGAPQLCSSICRNLGRHAHIDYCRNVKGQCQEPQSEHIKERMLPNPDRPKDWVSHKIYWARTGFKDPYSNVEQTGFGLCDAQCPGAEHTAAASGPARPSYCTMPIFHPPQPTDWQEASMNSYVSADGHFFNCPNPNNLRRAYHVIFVLDRRPLPGQPVTRLIRSTNNNRFGAVLSSLYGFWMSRGSDASGWRRDAYSVITFDWTAETQFENDCISDPDQLLQRIARIQPYGGTDFDAALRATRAVMENNWSTDRSPVVVFLSDGECAVSDDVIYQLCNRAVARGKPLSFHSVAFGTNSASLRRMVSLAEQVAQAAPRNPLSPLVPCGYTDVMDTIRLAETFLQIADSLKKPRASLIRM